MSLHELSPESINQLETPGNRRRSKRTLGKASIIRALYTERAEEMRQRAPITNPAFEQDRERIVNDAAAGLANASSLGEIAIQAQYPWTTKSIVHENAPEDDELFETS